ncbi:MAG: hypothetical protein AB7L90_21370 [Hyphomicrobiaceae bacterium]
MPHTMFSIVGAALSTLIIGLAMAYVAANPAAWQHSSNHPAVIKPAPTPIIVTAART